MLRNEPISLLLRSLCFAGAAAAVTACGGTGGSQSPIPLPDTGTAAGAGQASAASTAVQPHFSVVQSTYAGGTYASTVNVRLAKAPAAGDVLVLFFDVNRASRFPYSGQVSWPASASGSQWSYDGEVNSTVVLHHVVQAGESGSYTLNVGGAGSGWADYMVAEVHGANPNEPLNARALHAEPAGTTQFTFGTGVSPTSAGTFPLAFFTANQNGHSWSSIGSGWTIAQRNADYSAMLAYGPVQSATGAVNTSASLSSASSYPGAADVVLLNPDVSAAAAGSSATTTSPTAAPAETVSSTAPSRISMVQSRYAGSTYASTMHVQLAKAPAAGDLLVLFFDANKTPKFPYSGQVAWPATASGPQWSYDGAVNSTAILHHVVQAGETGSYTLNVGGSGGWADYMVAELHGANAANPIDNRLLHGVPAGTATFTFGSGITPAAPGTFPLAFFTANQNGHTWNAIGSGWTIAQRNADFSSMLAYGPLQSGTAPVNAAATLSSASSYAGAADVVLVNPGSSSATASAPSAPSPTSAPVSAPTPVPTAAPVSSSGYTYHGCPLYTANDWFTTNLNAGGSSYVPATVDPNSAAIIRNLAAAYPSGNFSANVDPSLEAVNIVPSVASTPAIGGLSYGFDNDPYNDDGSHTIPLPSHVYQEGTRGCTSSSGDCHVVVLDTNTCVDYETYNWDAPSWNGSSYNAKSGFVHNLRHPFNDQYQQDTVGPTAAHTPLLGTTDWGEEASLSAIPHILGFFLGKPGVADGGYVAPARAGQTCTSYCANKLPYGARLRLHASYPCPSASSYPQANLICNQMKNYGIILDDTTGLSNGFGVRLGSSANGSDPWRSSDYDQFLGTVKITDFDVMTLGTVH